MALAWIATPAVAGIAEGNAAWLAGDYNKAVSEWRPAADAGGAEAQFNLGQAYKLGRGVVTNLEEAEKWYRKAALQGFPDAQDILGLMLFRQGDHQEAMQWIEKSAARGEPRAMYVLGTAKFNGDFAAKDWPGAYVLLTRAAAAGITPAQQSLDQMTPYLTAADKAAAAAATGGQMASTGSPASSRVPEGAGGYAPVHPSASLGSQIPPPDQLAQAAPPAYQPPAGQAPAYQPPAYQPTPQGAPVVPNDTGPTVQVDGATVSVPGPEVNVRPDAAPTPSRGEQPPASWTKRPSPTTAAPPYARPSYAPPQQPVTTQPVPTQAPPPPAEAAPPPPHRPKPAVRVANGPWKIQLGAFATPGGAEEAWAKLGRTGAIAGLRYAPQKFGAVTRLQAAGIASKAEAARICHAVSARGMACFPVAP